MLCSHQSENDEVPAGLPATVGGAGPGGEGGRG